MFDEIEKAHPDVFNILLQVLDDGRLTDSQGRIVDFKNTIIIMTSNLGSNLILEADTDEKLKELKPEIHEMLMKSFRPEFINRIDEVITFSRLDKSCITSIVKNQLDRVAKRLQARRLKLDFDESAINFLSDVGYDPLFGARPIKRAIQTYLENPLAKEILSGKFFEDSTIKISKKSDEACLEFTKG